MRVLARYCEPDPKRAAFELLITAVPFALLWLAALHCVQRGWWLGLALTIPSAGFLVRLFMIQHDCGHGSFFRGRKSNDALGRILGMLTLTPYGYWRRTHATHHATAGNLDGRGVGDVTLLTVAEFRALPGWRRVAYRLSRHPAVLLGVGPFYLFLLKYRLPVGLMKAGRAPWVSAIATNLAIGGLVAALGTAVGFGTLLAVQLPTTLLAGAAGVWLFYVQHQFEDAYWARQEDWSFHAGALLGSTHYALPAILRWITANIGVHHVHHLASRIPSYRLGEVLADHPELEAVCRLTLRESVRCFKLALWDEAGAHLVPFGALEATSAPGREHGPASESRR